MNKDTLQFLLNRQKAGTLTELEQRQLDEWEATRDQDEGLEELYSGGEQLQVKDRMWEQVKLQTAPQGKLFVVPGGKKQRHPIKTAWLKYAAAIIIIAGAAVYLFNTNGKKHVANVSSAAFTKDVAAPTSNRATLTLANGQQIVLDSANNGTLATQGNVNIRKMADGRIIYAGNNNGEMQYNILTVPRGSKIASIVLSDGTKVFLNAASSLTYPVAFTGNERKVQITGEAYFEVAKDKSKKFVVSSGSVTTEVLGTHFNMNTYPDEKAQKITLLEGSVKVSGGSAGTIIQPGDQAAFENGKMSVSQSVDIDQVMAWKNGVFNFNNASCETVMKQLARWYNIEIVYPKGIPAIQFGGEIQQTLSLTEMLDALGAVEVKFEINKNKLIVLP